MELERQKRELINQLVNAVIAVVHAHVAVKAFEGLDESGESWLKDVVLKEAAFEVTNIQEHLGKALAAYYRFREADEQIPIVEALDMAKGEGILLLTEVEYAKLRNFRNKYMAHGYALTYGRQVEECKRVLRLYPKLLDSIGCLWRLLEKRMPDVTSVVKEEVERHVTDMPLESKSVAFEVLEKILKSFI